MMEGEHARVKPVAKGHFSSALVSVHLRIPFLEEFLERNPQAKDMFHSINVFCLQLAGSKPASRPSKFKLARAFCKPVVNMPT